MNINYGWVCPKCGRVYAPNQEMCLYCNGETASTLQSDSTGLLTNPCESNKTTGYPPHNDPYSTMTCSKLDTNLDCGYNELTEMFYAEHY